VSAAPEDRAGRLWLLLPLLLTVALYLPAVFHADWIVDDRPLLLNHLHPGDILGEWRVPTHTLAAGRTGGYLWRPLTSSVYQLAGQALGRSPPVFRSLNLVFHLLNLGLLGLVARRVGASWRGAALLATAVAVHPLLPDVVCWMADTYDLMAATFLLLSLWLSLGEGPGLAGRVASAGPLFLLALLGKEASLSWVLTLPAVLLLLRGWRPALAHTAVLVPTAALHSAWHSHVVGTFQTSALDLLRRDGADFLALWSGYLAWPLSLPVQAGFTHLVSPGQERLSLLGLLLLLTLVVALARRSRASLHLAAALGTWAVMITPGALAALGFGQQASRYLYLPLLLAAPLAGGVLVAIPARRAWLGLAATAIWCLAWLPRTVTRIAAWQDEHALFADELRAEPDNAFAQKALGRVLVGEGQVEQGLKLWYAALEHPPASTFVMDPQQERLDLARAARQAGVPRLALHELDAFLAEEAQAGRQVDASVHALYQAVQAEATDPSDSSPE